MPIRVEKRQTNQTPKKDMRIGKQPSEIHPWQAAEALLLLDGWAMLAHQWRDS